MGLFNFFETKNKRPVNKDGEIVYEDGSAVDLKYGIQTIKDEAYKLKYNIVSVILPGSVTSIGAYAFEKCINLESIVIPESVTSIAHGAFSWCKSLKSIQLPSKLTYIPWNAFAACENLESVTFSASVTGVGQWAFAGCNSLTDIYYGGTQADWRKIEFFTDGNEKLCGKKSARANIHYEFKYPTTQKDQL
jgi:hypothetical protein